MNHSSKTSKSAKTAYLASALLSVVLVGCGGSGCGTDTQPNPEMGSEAQISQLQQGQFVDSAVKGLYYETATQSGYTDENGNFNYLVSEVVEFYLGSTKLGEATGSSLLTPLLILSETDHSDKLENVLRILQTLDADGDASNGVEIPESAKAYLDEFTLPINNPAIVLEGSQIVTDLVATYTAAATLKIPLIHSLISERPCLILSAILIHQ